MTKTEFKKLNGEAQLATIEALIADRSEAKKIIKQQMAALINQLKEIEKETTPIIDTLENYGLNLSEEWHEKNQDKILDRLCEIRGCPEEGIGSLKYGLSNI